MLNLKVNIQCAFEHEMAEGHVVECQVLETLLETTHFHRH